MKNKRTPHFFFILFRSLTKATDLSSIEGLTMETKVVERVTGVSGNSLFIPGRLTPAATGDDSALVQVFDPSD